MPQPIVKLNIYVNYSMLLDVGQNMCVKYACTVKYVIALRETKFHIS